ncbi:MAG TPA: tripartite tricarboxylate transporter TctB family protein [Alphaproteobacteria bacterium]|nr:tripartite tricarboxylate transporter TctB family protein [Alphaproteobacteria bacterium]
MTEQRSLLTRERVAGIVLVLAAAAIAWESRVLPLGTWRNPGAAYMPLLTAVVLGLTGIVIALRGGGPTLQALAWPEARHAALLLAACAFAAWALERLGYRLTTAIMALFFLAVLERRNPIAAVIVALALSFGSFYLFSELLRVPLPRGPWNL